MTDNKATPDKPKRFQFGLRSLFVLTLAFVFIFGIYTYRKQNRKIIDQLHMQGDIPMMEDLMLTDENMTGLVLFGSDQLVLVSKLKNLEGLWVWAGGDTDFTPLQSLHKLRVLRLEDVRITDLSSIAKLKNLEELHLMGVPVTDLEPLLEKKNLKYLSLQHTKITKQHLIEFQTKMPNCGIFATGVIGAPYKTFHLNSKRPQQQIWDPDDGEEITRNPR